MNTIAYLDQNPFMYDLESKALREVGIPSSYFNSPAGFLPRLEVEKFDAIVIEPHALAPYDVSIKRGLDARLTEFVNHHFRHDDTNTETYLGVGEYVVQRVIGSTLNRRTPILIYSIVDSDDLIGGTDWEKIWTPKFMAAGAKEVLRKTDSDLVTAVSKYIR